ncbi:MAG: hypothetical protein PSX81_11685 [bacterium]|nr:hypothetical protein [bacterium]
MKNNIITLLVFLSAILFSCKPANNPSYVTTNEKPNFLWIKQYQESEISDKIKYPSSIKIYNHDKLLIKEYNIYAHGTRVHDSTIFYYDTIKRLKKKVYFYAIGTLDLKSNFISIPKKEVTEYIYNDSGRLLLKYITENNELRKVEGMGTGNKGPYGFTYDFAGFSYIYNGDIIYGYGLEKGHYKVNNIGTIKDSVITNNKNKLVQSFTFKYRLDTLIRVFRDYNDYSYLKDDDDHIFDYPEDSSICKYVRNKIVEEKKYYSLGETKQEVISYRYDTDVFLIERNRLKYLRSGEKDTGIITYEKEFKTINYLVL